MTPLSRRQALGLLGVGLTLGAGCSGGDGTDESISTGDLPVYAEVLAEFDAGEYAFGAVDLETFRVVTTETTDEERPGAPTDPLLANALGTIYLAYLVMLEAGHLGLGPVLEDRNTSDGGDEYLLFTPEANVFYGSYDVDGVADDLAAQGYDERRREADLVVFEDDGASLAVGATATAVAFATADGTEGDPVAAVERTVETAAGDRAPMHEVDEDFEWLLRAGDTDRVTFCLHATDGELDVDDASDLEEEDEEFEGEADLAFVFDAFAGSTGVLQHLDVVSDENRPTASAVITYASEDDVDEDALRAGLGTGAESATFVRDGRAVRAEAEFRSEFVDE